VIVPNLVKERKKGRVALVVSSVFTP